MPTVLFPSIYTNFPAITAFRKQIVNLTDVLDDWWHLEAKPTKMQRQTNPAKDGKRDGAARVNSEPTTPELGGYNPYTPPTTVDEPPADPAQGSNSQKRSWLKSFGIWSLVCIISALPSFGWAVGTIASRQVAALCTGIVIFIAGYTFADQLTQQFAWRRNIAFRLTLKIGYITRMVISILFPIGGFIDMLCGVVSMAAVTSIMSRSSPDGTGGFDGNDPGFMVTLLITLVQGTVLNIVLVAYMVAVFGFVVLAHRGRDQNWHKPS